ncbi:MAG: ribonuclease D [Candidatus Thioglobus sp.]|nr:MAG: ribonuclease D [Candidatus Thioglobus sp.]RUM85158.1 MAG: ribonuclease D [Candidatus Thioglobus sp.]RUM85757.1 MAG: ribonuclease D [Candidatus Thioglobus sp.]
MIQTQAQLYDFLKTIQGETELAIDTEFKRVSTYYPVLCLVQIATKSATDCIDVLALDDLEPLFDKLYQNDCVWIVHSARQDIEAMHCLSGRLPQQLFDTQIAASLLNHPIQISYQALTESLQNVYLEKAYTRLDWTTRPLPEAAIEYALDDVRYLIKNYHQLKVQLQAENKLDWIIEEAQNLLNIDLYLPPIDQAWQRVKGLSRINKNAHVLAAQLAAWREHRAQSNNRPRKWILADEPLIAHALGEEKLSNKAQKSFDDFLAQHISIQNIEISIGKNKPPTKTEKAQKVVLQKLIQEKANQYNLAIEVMASSKSLLKYIRGDRSVMFCQGWRYHLLQGELENAK